MAEKIMFLVFGVLMGIMLGMLIFLMVTDYYDAAPNIDDPARACFECGKHMEAKEFDLINNTYIYECEKCNFTLITDIPMGSEN